MCDSGTGHWRVDGCLTTDFSGQGSSKESDDAKAEANCTAFSQLGTDYCTEGHDSAGAKTLWRGPTSSQLPLQVSGASQWANKLSHFCNVTNCTTANAATGTCNTQGVEYFACGGSSFGEPGTFDQD